MTYPLTPSASLTSICPSDLWPLQGTIAYNLLGEVELTPRLPDRQQRRDASHASVPRSVRTVGPPCRSSWLRHVTLRTASDDMTVCLSNGVPFKFASKSSKHSRFVTSVDVKPSNARSRPVLALKTSLISTVRPKWIPLCFCWKRWQPVRLRRNVRRRQEHLLGRSQRSHGDHFSSFVRQGLGSDRHCWC